MLETNPNVTATRIVDDNRNTKPRSREDTKSRNIRQQEDHRPKVRVGPHYTLPTSIGAHPCSPHLHVKCAEKLLIDSFLGPLRSERQMILNALDEVAKIIDMLPHWSVGGLFELAELVFKKDNSGVALSTILSLECFPDSCDVFGGGTSSVCCSVVLECVHEVIIHQVVLMIPFVNVNLVRLVRIGLSDKNSAGGPWSRSFAEIDDVRTTFLVQLLKRWVVFDDSRVIPIVPKHLRARNLREIRGEIDIIRAG